MMRLLPVLLLLLLLPLAIAAAADVDPAAAAAAAAAPSAAAAAPPAPPARTAAAPPAAGAAPSSQLLMVYSIQRHGARNVLPKSSLLAESEATGGPTLLPQGKRQCRAAGKAFAARYIEPSTCNATRTCLAPDGGAGGFAYGVVGAPGVGFSNWNVFANSSALDRTLMSAQAFLSGVFPSSPADAAADEAAGAAQGAGAGAAALVPVFSVSEREDWRIRGYARCPEYTRRLEAWLLRSPEFLAKSEASAALRERVGRLVPQLNTSLASWWNVFDALSVWRDYGVGDPAPPLDAATYEEAAALANWLETRKMAPALAGNLLGGAIVGDLLARLAAAERGAGSSADGGAGGGQYYRLLTVSSHYNTQLGVLAALQQDDDDDEQQPPQHLWRNKIPALASVLAFELHGGSGGGGDLAVRAVAQDGPSAAWVAVPLPCAEPGGAAERLAGLGACTLARFRALAGPRALNSSQAWCAACGNTKVLACRAAAMERQLAAVGVSADDAAAGGGGGGDGGALRRYSSPGMVAAWCVVSVAAAAALAAAALLGTRAVRRRRRAAGGGGGGGVKAFVGGDEAAEQGRLQPVQPVQQQQQARGLASDIL